MDNNRSQSRIYITSDLSLVFKGVNSKDIGIYRCHGEEGQEAEKNFNYRIESGLYDIL